MKKLTYLIALVLFISWLVLVTGWLFGYVGFYPESGLVHMLLAMSVEVTIIRGIQDRKPI